MYIYIYIYIYVYIYIYIYIHIYIYIYIYIHIYNKVLLMLLCGSDDRFVRQSIPVVGTWFYCSGRNHTPLKVTGSWL